MSFVSVTQSFNKISSMGRLTLNVLLSFAQFKREVIGERVRDKIAASKRKGFWGRRSRAARISDIRRVSEGCYTARASSTGFSRKSRRLTVRYMPRWDWDLGQPLGQT